MGWKFSDSTLAGCRKGKMLSKCQKRVDDVRKLKRGPSQLDNPKQNNTEKLDEDAEMAQGVQCMLHNHEDLS